MSEHRAHVRWTLTGGEFTMGRYSREHSWTFDGGVTVPASPAPTSVPAPFSNPAHVDPEEAFVAAVSSCHMLSFLWVASRRGFEVLGYEDAAVGRMTKNAQGRLWVSDVDLSPRIAYGGTAPSAEEEAELHHRAHEECYIANSVRTEIRVNAPLDARLSAAQTG